MPELRTEDFNDQEVFAVGTHNGDKYSAADLDAMVEAFPKAGFKPPVKLGHSVGQKLLKGEELVSAGWIENLRRVGVKLLADFKKVPGKIADLIKAGAFRQKSAEIVWDFNSGKDKFPRVLTGVALLGEHIPAVADLNDIVSLYKKPPDDLAHEFKGEAHDVHNYTSEFDYQQFIPFGPVTDFLLTSRRKAKADVNFIDDASLGSQCGGCKFYIENLNACTLVEGYIEADDGCNLFEAGSEDYSKAEGDVHPYTIMKRGNKWCLIAKSGKTLGCHSTKEGAAAQEGAVKANKDKYQKEGEPMRFNRNEIREICPSCADSMESKGISALTFASAEALKMFAFADMKECMGDSGMMKDNPDMAGRKKACQEMMDKKMSTIQKEIDTYQKGGVDMTKEELAEEREKMKKELMSDMTADFDAKIAAAKVEGAKDAETRYAKSIEEQGEQIKKMESEKRSSGIDNWIDSQKRLGKIAAVEEPRMKAFLLSLEDGKTLTYSQDGKEASMSQAELFKDIVVKRPSLFKVLSKAGDPKDGDVKTYATAGDEVHAKALEYQKEQGEKDYRTAAAAVLTADPDLNERYMRLQN